MKAVAIDCERQTSEESREKAEYRPNSEPILGKFDIRLFEIVTGRHVGRRLVVLAVDAVERIRTRRFAVLVVAPAIRLGATRIVSNERRHFGAGRRDVDVGPQA